MSHRRTGLVRCIALAVLCSGGGAACTREARVVEQTFPAMGTAVSIRVPAARSDSLGLASHMVRDVTDRLYGMVSVENPRSELARLNQIARTRNLPISRETHRLLQLARHYGDLTEGSFDITVGPLAFLWGFGDSAVPRRPPNEEVLRAARAGTGWDKIEIGDNQVVRLKSSLTKLSLSAVAKGYAVDLCIIELRREGISDILLNIGGESARCLGAAGKHRPWDVPLQDPLSLEEQLGVVQLADGDALAVSRLYENFVSIEGRRHGHILDPRTGAPAQGTAAAFVVAPTSTEADALSTALVVLGLEAAPRILARFPRCRALIIPDREPVELWYWGGFEQQFRVTPGLRENVHTLSGAFEEPDPSRARALTAPRRALAS